MVEFPYSFASDNYAGIHPELLQAIIDANVGHASAYGADLHTKAAEDKIKQLFNTDCKAFFIFNGTGANTLALSHLCQPYQAVLTASVGHIHVNECGAPEHYGGFKLIPIDTPDGKLTVELMTPYFDNQGNMHRNQVKVISLTQVTELGTCYTLDELKAITEFAHQHDCYVYIDGARLSNAAAHLNMPIAKWTTEIGVDMLSFGGTKNGMTCGEALIILNPQLHANFEYVRKQGMQLASKHRFISAQYNAFLTNDLWLKLAKHTNDMASLLAEKLSQINGVKVLHTVEGNMLFVTFPPDKIPKLQAKCFFYCMDETTGLSRLVMSHEITPEHIEDFAEHVAIA